MNKKLISKILAISFTHLVFNIMMRFTEGNAGSASSIAQSLKWLSFGIGEQYGIITLICIAFVTDSFLKRIL
ncbi:hypothetical protein H6F41_16715 [Pseudanabaena sp. FACHB-723]|uniref:Uncharacterized protein n=1 Tax=Pseudanabaena mucicola FACHB-723 TaxID=2692860 RepID=A0ABR8A0K4_9CYAN|nr:hypothetical protein [Pseudanabaena mucicola FACHB-723]